MEEQFIPYTAALKLKMLYFDEPCLKLWEKTILFTSLVDLSEFKKVVSERYVLAPLWQQAFYFLEEKFKLSSSIQLKSANHLGKNYEVVIINFADFISEETTFRKDGFKTPLEAKNYCLNTLIQFCS